MCRVQEVLGIFLSLWVSVSFVLEVVPDSPSSLPEESAYCRYSPSRYPQTCLPQAYHGHPGLCRHSMFFLRIFPVLYEPMSFKSAHSPVAQDAVC